MRKILILLLLVLPMLSLGQEADSRGYIVKVGDKCPDFPLLLPSGEKTSIKELKGSVIMLQFTASWCGVCRKEMPHIEKDIWKVYKDKGLKLYGIDRGESPEVTSAFAEKMRARKKALK